MDISDLDADEKFMFKIVNIDGILVNKIQIPKFSIPQAKIIAGG